MTKAERTGKDFDYLYLEDGRYSLNTVKSAIHTKNSSELEPALLEVIRDVLPIWKRAVYHKQLISFMIEHFYSNNENWRMNWAMKS